MIVCVAGNPSIDKLFVVDRLVPGEIHRPERFVQVPGGKGLNVARTVAALGEDVRAAAVLGGHAGRWVEDALAAEGVRGAFARSAGETRSSLSVADHHTNRLTEFYENGPGVEPEAWAELERLVCGLLDSAGWLTLSGSLPPGAPVDGYARLIERGRDRGVRSALDARGAALAAGVAARPNVVKVNAGEAAELLGAPVSTEREAVWAAGELRAMAAEDGAGIVTRGEDGAVLAGPDGSACSASLDAWGPYPVGSGDAFLAGMVVGLRRGMDWPDALGLAMGAAAANAETPGAGRVDGTRAARLAVLASVRPVG